MSRVLESSLVAGGTDPGRALSIAGLAAAGYSLSVAEVADHGDTIPILPRNYPETIPILSRMRPDVPCVGQIAAAGGLCGGFLLSEGSDLGNWASVADERVSRNNHDHQPKLTVPVLTPR